MALQLFSDWVNLTAGVSSLVLIVTLILLLWISFSTCLFIFIFLIECITFEIQQLIEYDEKKIQIN